MVLPPRCLPLVHPASSTVVTFISHNKIILFLYVLLYITNNHITIIIYINTIIIPSKYIDTVECRVWDNVFVSVRAYTPQSTYDVPVEFVHYTKETYYYWLLLLQVNIIIILIIGVSFYIVIALKLEFYCSK